MPCVEIGGGASHPQKPAPTLPRCLLFPMSVWNVKRDAPSKTPRTQNDISAVRRCIHGYLLVRHADARLGEGARAEDLQALQQCGEVDPELCPLHAVVLLEQASLQDPLCLRVLGLSRNHKRHRILRYLRVGAWERAQPEQTPQDEQHVTKTNQGGRKGTTTCRKKTRGIEAEHTLHGCSLTRFEQNGCAVPRPSPPNPFCLRAASW